MLLATAYYHQCTNIAEEEEDCRTWNPETEEYGGVTLIASKRTTIHSATCSVRGISATEDNSAVVFVLEALQARSGKQHQYSSTS